MKTENTEYLSKNKISRSWLAGISLLMPASIFAQQDLPKPNVLFVISDDQSFPHASAYGTDWVKTPGFDQVADRGLLFMNCYTPNAKCAPSRSIIITGRHSWQLEEAGNHVCFFPDDYKSFIEVLTEETDYYTGFTGKGVEPVVVYNRQLTGKPYNSIRLTPPGKAISNEDYFSNFKQFLDQKPRRAPFFFWFGAREPHRDYQYRIGIEVGNKTTDQIKDVPDFWPDNETVRTDMLDYAFEIEYYDDHLLRMIRLLEERGELDNTLIVVTSDNGMPFPRAKGAGYEYSNHLPLAIMWPKGIKNPGRVIDDYVSFIDFAPTFLELAGISNELKYGMQVIQGKSLLPLFRSEKEGKVMKERDYVLLGHERHDVGRPDDVGYPVRSIIRDGYLYIHNFKPDRWPMCNPETGYLNTDGSPTKTAILEMRRNGENNLFWELCFGKRGSEELYYIEDDPDCLNNLIADPKLSNQIRDMKTQLFTELARQRDPRVLGNGDIFDKYPYAHPVSRDFYNRYMRGEIRNHITNWVSPTDFELVPIPIGD
jgi:N-sulfoglucosamine sulfohydrolase